MRKEIVRKGCSNRRETITKCYLLFMLGSTCRHSQMSRVYFKGRGGGFEGTVRSCKG